MNDSKLQFRVGLFVVGACVLLGAMSFKFGEIKTLWDKNYTIAVHFKSAPGVHPSSPVQTNGLAIGKVREVVLDDKRGGVTVLVDISEQYRLRKGMRPTLVRSLLGDTTIEFIPGTEKEFVQPGTLIEGETPVDPMELVNDFEEKMTKTLETFAATSTEWQQVAANLNGLMDTHHGSINEIVARAAESLQQFTTTMTTANRALQNANRYLDDPEYYENLKQTMTALPEMVNETKGAISAVRTAVEAAEKNLANLESVTSPLAKRSASIVTKLDNTLGNMEDLSAELTLFSRMLTREDGSIQKFASDPELYRNLNFSAASLAVLLKNLEPVLGDLRIFSDKIARHPELIGVSGVIKGSSGLKDSTEDGTESAARPGPPKR